MRHTNLISAIKQAKSLAVENGRAYYASGARGRYLVSEEVPKGMSFVQATPSGMEWSHVYDPDAKSFRRTRLSGLGLGKEEGLEMLTMGQLIEKLEKRGGDSVSMVCLECGKRFKKKMSSKTTDVKCPKCGGYDVEVE